MACGFFNGGVNIQCYDDDMWFGDPSIADPYDRYGGNAADNGVLMSNNDQAFWDDYWDFMDGTGLYGNGAYVPDSGTPTFSTTGYGVTDPDPWPNLGGYDPFGYSDPTWNILFGGAPEVPRYPDPVTQQCPACNCPACNCPSTGGGSGGGTKPATGGGGSGGGASLPATNGRCPQGYQKYGNLCIAPQQQQKQGDNMMLWLILIVIGILLYQGSE